MSEPNAQGTVDWTARPLRVLLRTDGSQKVIAHPVTMDEALRLIGAEAIDVVSLRHLGAPLHVMLVDDNGWEYEVIEHSPGHFEHRTIRPHKEDPHMSPESKVVSLHVGKKERRKRKPHVPDSLRLQLAYAMPEMPLSACAVGAVLGVSRRQLLRLRALPDFPPAHQYKPGGWNYWLAWQVLQWMREHSGPG